MKFELEPNNRGALDAEIIDDIRKVAKKLGKQALTRSEYDKNGRFGGTTIARRLGSWNNALEKSELRLIRQTKDSAEDCLNDLRNVSKLLNKDSVSIADYKKAGKLSKEAFDRCFGGWKNAIEKAGLKQSENYHERVSDEEYFQNIEMIWRKIGRQPRTSHLIKPHSKYSSNAYSNRFGSWRKALESFVSYVNKEIKIEKLTENNVQKIKVYNRPVKFRNTSRSISWRMRFIVMRRDNFTCRICGLTPALKPGTNLEVDHIKPYSHDGETEINNLQTLCQKCNNGKSDLSISVN